MEAIKISSEALTTKIDAVAVDVSIMRHEFDKLQHKISVTEARVTKVKKN